MSLNKISRNPFITIGAAVGCSLAIALSLAAILFVFVHGSTPNGRKNCNASLDLRDAVVSVLKDASRQVDSSDPRAQDARLFYNHSIQRLERIDCNNG